MTEQDYNEIIKVFMPSDDECKLYEYLDSYRGKICKYLINNTLNQDQLKHYMLIGFWINYRAANHHGGDFSTVIKKKEFYDQAYIDDLNEYFKDILVGKFDVDLYNRGDEDFSIKVKLYNKYFTPIKDTSEYINATSYIVDYPSGNNFYRFVIDAKS